MIYQLLENNLVQPAIVGHAVDISALAALGGHWPEAHVAGLIGAVLAIPIVDCAPRCAPSGRATTSPPAATTRCGMMSGHAQAHSDRSPRTPHRTGNPGADRHG
ncbi:MAG: hypothetical protein R2710_04380 [Acidimicrobiales bacterium]